MEPESTPLQVAPSTADDRQAIRAILLGSGIFGPADADCVDGMFTEALARPSADGYQFLSCREEQPHSGMIGFACAGREALTRGTWDLFWVCVDRAARGKGAGRALLQAAERLAREDGARLMVIYTSSTEPYAPARGLYASQGFTRNAIIPGYYADGDDLFIYTKGLK
jgi:ribosomal protein S18 acetylase RimI-like enzyme